MFRQVFHDPLNLAVNRTISKHLSPTTDLEMFRFSSQKLTDELVEA